MEQVRERGEPGTNCDSVEEDTITCGLGTGGEMHTLTPTHGTEKGVLVSDGVTYTEQ